MARACKIARPRNLCYCEFELRHSMGETPVLSCVLFVTGSRPGEEYLGRGSARTQREKGNRAFRRKVGTLCLHFWNRPKPLPALWRMPKATDRLSADCINPCLNIFLRSTERGFIELHIEARLHDCAFASFLKVLQRVSQPAAIGGKRIHDLPGQVRSARSRKLRMAGAKVYHQTGEPRMMVS